MAEEKLKILYLMQVLLEETDKAHPMNATQLCDRMMKDHGYSYNRKTIYARIIAGLYGEEPLKKEFPWRAASRRD